MSTQASLRLALLSAELQAIVDQLIPLLRHFARSEYGIALGGAHAKGTDDKESDLDLYLFATDVLPNVERTRSATRFSSDIERLVSWGGDSPFVQAGTDFYYRKRKVECWLRNSEGIQRAIVECEAGIVKRELVTWTTTGFYNHCCLSDLKLMIPIEDPNGMLARFKVAIAVYPPRLQESIVRTHLAAARFWPGNFHYDSAIERRDVIYTAGIVQQVVHNLIQVLFAVNQVYFPGDKKLAHALGHLERAPNRIAERIQGLLLPEEPLSVGLLQRQQAELRQLLKEVEDLVPIRLR